MLEALVAVALRATVESILFAALLAAFVLVATRVLALNAATRHALWTAALVATALIPVAGIAGSGWKTTAAQRSPDLPASIATAPVGEAPAAQHGHVRRTLSTAAAHVRAFAPPSASRVRRGHAVLPSWTPHLSARVAAAALSVWAAGVLVGLIGLAASVLRVRGLKRRSSPLDGTLVGELPWLTELDRGREIYLRLSYETETPVAIGFRRPVILIPTELATADGLTAIESLVLHEHAHLRRFDDWTNLVQRIIERLFWFNPIVWLVGRRIALEREIASDDAVVERTGAAHEYASSLWRLAREMRMPEHAVVAPGALLTRKQISVRIEQLLDGKRSSLHRSPATALAVTLAGALAVVFVATSAPAVELPAPAPAIVLVRSDGAATTGASSHAHSAYRARPAMAVAANTLHEHPSAPSTAAPTAAPTATPTAASSARQSSSSSVPSSSPRSSLRAAVIRAGSRAHAVASIPSAPSAPSVPAIPKMQDADGTQHPAPALPAVPAFPAAPALPAEHGRSGLAFRGVTLSRELVMSCSGCSFRGAVARNLDLHNVMFNGNDLTGVDFSGADLSGAHFLGSNVNNTNFADADLRRAEFNGVELGRANFSNARLEGVRFIGADLRSASLRNVPMRDVLANCEGCDFGRLDLRGQDLHGIVLNGVDLSRADLRDANLSNVHFIGVDLQGASLRGADLTGARLDGCSLDDADLRGARTAGLVVTGA